MKKKQVIKWIGLAICLCTVVIGIVWGIKAISHKGDTPANEETTAAAVAQNTTEAKPEPTAPSSAEATEAPTKESEKSTEVATQAPTEEATEAPTEEATEAPTEVAEENWEEWLGQVSKDVKIGEVKPKLLSAQHKEDTKNYKPSVGAYSVDSDLSNVTNLEQFRFSQELKDILASYNFAVIPTDIAEFYEIYETNRYLEVPSLVTTDSLMHTFHLFYQNLQKNTEKQYLYDNMKKLTEKMLKNSLQQYVSLKGSEWEEAATRNVVYFSVAAELIGIETAVPSDIRVMISEEVEKVMQASGSGHSLVVPEQKLGEDYSQYEPRSYYADDPKLKKYFRVMMWYGRINFLQKYEQETRCALLMNIALADPECYNEWYTINEVTSFLVGSSDDLLYNEYIPIITGIYGNDFTLDALIGNEAAWEQFTTAITLLRDPKINSMMAWPDDPDDWRSEVKGFRLLGQRYVLDAEVFQNLIYSDVKEDEQGLRRYLPDALDIPAAFGSDVALDILIRMGNDKYPNYLEKMAEMRETVSSSDTYWTSSVTGGWLYTLMPLLKEKGAGYPSFMTNEAWIRRSLEGFLGSWTELKHDTILYAKQAYEISESGGEGFVHRYDDRGYVEPEPELYERLVTLAAATRDGLKDLGYLPEEKEEAINRLIELSGALKEISIKELQGQGLTDEEYELIRGYGGSLEHFWDDTTDRVPLDGYIWDEATETWIESDEAYWEYPNPDAPVIADVATGTDSITDEEKCLEEGTSVSYMYVIFPIDGELRIARGAVFTQYQFEQPVADRMSDEEWRSDLYRLSSDTSTGWIPEWTYDYKCLD